MPANPPRGLKKKKQTLNARALTANEIAIAAAKLANRQASQSARDVEIEARREQEFHHLETQDEIVVAAPSRLPPSTAPIECLASSRSPSPIPPPSTAQPAIPEARAKRQRAQSGFYAALEGGDSQEIKRRK